MPAPTTTLLLLADGRLPAGGHAHSGGLEAAVAAGRVRDADDVAAFLLGRLATAGLVSASFAAAACHGHDPATLDAELDARTPSPALRRASRQQGRALLRAGRAIWSMSVRPTEAHQPVALGLLAAAAGLEPLQAATITAYGSVSGPSSAAVRLLGLDPYRAYAVVAELADACDRVAARAAAAAAGPIAELPASGAPLLDISAEIHASWEVRLFAS
jgi:urease accessory protein